MRAGCDRNRYREADKKTNGLREKRKRERKREREREREKDIERESMHVVFR